MRFAKIRRLTLGHVKMNPAPFNPFHHIEHLAMNTDDGFNQKLAWLAGLAAVIVFGTFFLPAIPQDTAYHQFADENPWLGIPNFWNVASNLPFLLIGLLAIKDLNDGSLAIVPTFKMGYLIFFIGVALVGPGSAYYHWSPDNHTLVWDRLPMTVAFMALFAIVIAEYLSVAAAQRLLWPLLAIGFVSVFYWDYTEGQGRGDLRLYGLVQFLPLLLIPLILLLFRPTFSGAGYWWAMLAAYLGAKITESLDGQIFGLFYIISGHSIKHLLAALGAYYFWVGLKRREKRVDS